MIGSATSTIWALPFLLSRAGFQVDVITRSRPLRLSRFARRVDTVESGRALVEQARDRCLLHAYDWVIATDDGTLGALARLEWPPGRLPRFLPISPGKHLPHLHSKIGLSNVLSAAGVKTPAFRVARDCEEAIAAASVLGYPVLVKVDASGGGLGVRECRADAEVMDLRTVFAGAPLLIQKKIEGPLIDLSAIYFDSELVHFTYSRIDRTVRPFGVSAVRTYHPSSLVAPEIFEELRALGRVLGASGFVNVSCIEASDGSGRHFFEADMRPNAWVDYSRYYGEDAAPRIRVWFSGRRALTRENAVPQSASRRPMTVAHFLRLSLWELSINRYGVWRFIPWAEGRLVRRLLLARAISSGGLLARRLLSPRTMEALRGWIRRAGLRIE